MAITGVKQRNRSALLRKLASLPEVVRTEVGKAINEGAEEIAALQRRLAPKKTGALARSIVVTRGGNAPKYAALGASRVTTEGEADLSVIVSAGNSEVRYAHLVEFGAAPHKAGGKFEGADHPGAKAQPFFYPGYRALKKRTRARISRAGRKAVKAGAAGS